MRRLNALVRNLLGLFRRGKKETELSDEIRAHLDGLIERNVAAGMSPEDARYEAHRRFGGVEQITEQCRDFRGGRWVEQFVRDLGYAGRMFRRERGFTVVALLIIAVGVGLNTTVFSLVNTVLLRPIPFAYGDRLIWIYNGNPGSSSHDLSSTTSQIGTWDGLRETNRTLEQIEAYDPFSLRQSYRLTSAGAPETIISVNVSPGLFGMLGVHPMLGRLFLPEDGAKNAPYRVILSHQLWLTHYGAAPHIVGQAIQINGGPAEVIGVLPEADTFTSVFFPAVRVDLYAPLVNAYVSQSGNVVALIGRAKPDQAVDAIRADLKLSVAQIKKQRPQGSDQYFFANVVTLHEWVAGSLKRPLLFLWIAAGLVLAIVSFNLGGLLLARGAVRRKELALRCALGAGQMCLTRQLLTECFGLVGAGSLLGGLIAWGFIHFLAVRSSVEIPLLHTLRLDGASLGFTVLLCLITVGLCGALPAWKLARIGDIHHALKNGGRSSSSGRQGTRTLNALVVVEVALACVLAISSGLMVRSFSNFLKVDLGFEPRDLIAVRVDPVCDGSQAGYLESVLDRVRAMAGVEQAALTDCIPVERDRSWGLFPLNKDNPNEQRWQGAHIRLVSSGLFGAMGTTLVAGRDFNLTDTKDHPGVIIINRNLAEQLWPGGEALGRQVNVNGNFPCTVIGVAADVRHDGPEIPADNEMYLSLHQVEDAGSWDMMVRTKLPVATLTAGLRNALRDVDATLPLTKVRPMQNLVDRTLSSRSLLVSLISGFAIIAVGLAALGLYGVISYMVTQQTKEIGIRMALGADVLMVQRDIVGKTMRLALGGLVLGLAGTVATGRALQFLLYGVTATDAITYVVAAVTILSCALIAGYLPARRASRVDPIISLRAE